jgi:hypothetical protein
MNTKKRASRNVGFGVQKGIDFEAGEAVLLLRISNPRRLNTKILIDVLVKYFRGGYKTLILSMNRAVQERLDLLEFLNRLQAVYNESRYLPLERKLIRDARGIF